MDLTSPVTPAGSKITLSAFFIIPVSILPTGTVPTPVMEYTSWIGTLRGSLVGFSGAVNSSRAFTKAGPLYHGVLSLLVDMLSPSKADSGMKCTSLGL